MRCDGGNLAKNYSEEFSAESFVFRQHQWCQGVFDPELKTHPRIDPELKTHRRMDPELKTHPRMDPEMKTRPRMELRTPPRMEPLTKTTSVESPLPVVSNFEF